MAAQQAEELKRRGNECFGRGKLAAAIEAYTEAISLCPGVAVYHTNRATCFSRRQNFERVICDCRAALAIDSVNIKAHYLLGQALSAGGDGHDEGVEHLHRALELCKEATVSYKLDILRALLAARKRKWEAGRDARAAHFDAAAAMISQAGGSGMDCGSPDAEAGAAACASEALAALRARWEPRRVPDYLCCQITMEPMLEPVTTPCGVSYERAALDEHLRKVGAFDPVTRKPLDQSQLHPNLALRDCIAKFLEEHPWAYDCDS